MKAKIKLRTGSIYTVDFEDKLHNDNEPIWGVNIICIYQSELVTSWITKDHQTVSFLSKDVLFAQYLEDNEDFDNTVKF